MTDEFVINKVATLTKFAEEYGKLPFSPSLADKRVSYRMRPDGLTIREVRVMLKARKGATGANAEIA